MKGDAEAQAALGSRRSVIAAHLVLTLYGHWAVNGRDYRTLIVNSHDLHPNERGLVDKPLCGSRFQGTEAAGRITQLLGDSATFDFTDYQNRMDMVFLDGSHAYRYVLNDTHAARRLLREGRGIIVWHDYSDGPAAFDGVAQALHELREADPFYSHMRRIKGTSLVVLIRT